MDLRTEIAHEMTQKLGKTRNIMTHQRWQGMFACLVLTALCGGWTTSAEASIMMSKAPEFVLDEGAGGSASEGANRSESVPVNPPGDQGPAHASELFGDPATLPGSAPSGNSSSSGSGTGGSSPTATACLVAVLASDPDLAGWVSGPACLSLPMPLDNDLLRPPRRS